MANAAGEVLIVTGMSGAGRTTAANALEDLGWYVVDNLPPQMLRPLLEMSEAAAGALPHVAAVVDVRGRDLFGALPAVTEALRKGRSLRVVFLDADRTRCTATARCSTASDANATASPPSARAQTSSSTRAPSTSISSRPGSWTCSAPRARRATPSR